MRAYRERYTTCHRQYSLAVPFLERIVSLGVEGGFTGQITANSFMKREFGKKLIEQLFPNVDLTHIIDTSGLSFGTKGFGGVPTVIMLIRNAKPTLRTIRTVMGIRGEPSAPKMLRMGLVWSAIISQIDQPGSQSEFVTVSDSSRELFQKHPWSIGGGGAAELKETIESRCQSILGSLIADVGRSTHTGEDDVFYARQAR